MPNLIVERGREKGTSYELKPDTPCFAGRDPASVQIVISDPASSRRHFQVAARGGKWYVTDLGSKNHTYLNAEKLDKETLLTSGDRIQVGETVLSFLADETAEDAADKASAQGLNGKEIGGYKILDRLGRGGMGTVFKAKQISLNRVVALKVLASKFAKDPKFVEKFVSEARAAGQLNHPNVVQVFDVGKLGGLHFFSMELMEAGCVQDLLSAAPEGRLTWQEAMPLIVDATRGLVFAEKRGIIHRDIKPDNLMLTSEQRVKIGDLGLAKKAEEGAGDKSIFGTPHFIAPEQAQGKELTHAADLYALGATFYRMVTGKTPFSGDTVKEILKKQINDPHQPIHEIVPDFPEDLEAIVDKLMAKKVENRYQSATKLLEDLEAFQLAHQIELSGARKLNKPLMIGLTLVALAAVSVGIYYATRPKEKEYVPGETIIKTVEVGDKGPKLTPEQEQKLIAGPAKDAYYAIKDKDPREVTLAKKKELLDLAEEYESLSTKHPNPAAAEAIKPGLERAKEIRTSLQRLEEEKAAVEKDANDWWQACTKKLGELEAAKNWAEAIRLADQWLKDARNESRMKIVPAAKAELAKVEEREIALAEKDYHELAVAADQEVANGGDLVKSSESIKAWADRLEATHPTQEKLKEKLLEARNKVSDLGELLAQKLNAELDQDRVAFTDAIRALRMGGSGGGLVFDCKFEEAARQLQTASASLRAYPFQDRAARHVERLHAEQKAWAGFVQLLGAGKLFANGDVLKDLPGMAAGVTCKLDIVKDPPTTERFTVETVLAGGVGKGTKQFAWAEFSREELASIFVTPKLDKLPGDVALGLAWVFVELGHDDAAAKLFERATADKVPLAADEETALRLEINAIKDYDTMRALRDVSSDPTMLLSQITQWRQKYVATDFFVLMDGRPGASLPLLTDEQINEYVKNLGKKPAK